MVVLLWGINSKRTLVETELQHRSMVARHGEQAGKCIISVRDTIGVSCIVK